MVVPLSTYFCISAIKRLKVIQENLDKNIKTTIIIYNHYNKGLSPQIDYRLP